MLTRSDKLLFLFTFIVGLATGIFLYFSSFMPVYAPGGGDVSTKQQSESFSVNGRSYGGLTFENYVHPSFRITESGRYSFLRGGVNVEGQEPEGGMLPQLLFSDLMETIKDTDLEIVAKPGTKEECNTFFDASDYIYRVAVDGIHYEIDTCTSNISYEHKLLIVLEDIWMYMHDPQSYQDRPRDNSSGAGYFESFLRSYFVPDESENDTVTEVSCTADAKLCPDGTAVGRSGPSCEFDPCPGD